VPSSARTTLLTRSYERGKGDRGPLSWTQETKERKAEGEGGVGKKRKRKSPFPRPNGPALPLRLRPGGEGTKKRPDHDRMSENEESKKGNPQDRILGNGTSTSLLVGQRERGKDHYSREGVLSRSWGRGEGGEELCIF